MSESAVLEIHDLVVHFETRRGFRQRTTVRAVDGVSFDISQGEILALVGESGCGKSTIAMSVMRLLAPTSGHILVEGRDLASLRGRELRRARQRIQMIFQDPFGSLDSRQTVYESVAEPLVVHGLGRQGEERRRRVLAALDLAHLRPPERLAANYPHELSGGQRQRVAIASAMVLEPALVIADEPVSMLDVSARAGILRLMMDLRDRTGVSYLFITHELAVAWMVADRLAVLYLGRVVEIGTSPEVVAHPAHPYTRALLEVTSGDGELGEGAVLAGETPSASRVPEGCRFHPRCPLYAERGQPEVCRTQDPTLCGVGRAAPGEREHLVACHFPDTDDRGAP